jgi:hypothetical protein
MDKGSSSGVLVPGVAPESQHARIAQRARELWEARGRIDGHANEDWLQAEAEVRAGDGPRLSFIQVRFKGRIYTGEYDAAQCSYRPGELRKGERIAVSFDRETMYLKFSDGRGLMARIVRVETV